MRIKRFFMDVRVQISILLAVEMGILLCVFLRGYTKEKVRIDIPYTDIIGTTYPDDRDGWYVDATFPLAEGGLFDYTEDIVLTRGTYDITVYYETDTDKNFCLTTAGTKSLFGLKSDRVKLSAKTSSTTFMVYLSEDVNDFKLSTYFGGEGYLVVKGLAITETRAALRIRVAVLFTLFLLLDVCFLAVRGGVAAEKGIQQTHGNMGGIDHNHFDVFLPAVLRIYHEIARCRFPYAEDRWYCGRTAFGTISCENTA